MILLVGEQLVILLVGEQLVILLLVVAKTTTHSAAWRYQTLSLTVSELLIELQFIPPGCLCVHHDMTSHDIGMC